MYKGISVIRILCGIQTDIKISKFDFIVNANKQLIAVEMKVILRKILEIFIVTL